MERNGHILVQSKIPACSEGLGKTMTVVSMVGLSAAFEPVTLGCKWEKLVLVSSCYVGLGTARYSEV